MSHILNILILIIIKRNDIFEVETISERRAEPMTPIKNKS